MIDNEMTVADAYAVAKKLAMTQIKRLHDNYYDQGYIHNMGDSDMDMLVDAVKVLRLCDQKEPRSL